MKRIVLASLFVAADANQKSGITWDEATFTEYIKDPKAKIPGTRPRLRKVLGPSCFAVHPDRSDKIIADDDRVTAVTAATGACPQIARGCGMTSQRQREKRR